MDEDMAYALSLQEQFYGEKCDDRKENFRPFNHGMTGPLSIVDESWELIDPVPDIRQLFLQFNDAYFQGKLAGVEVKWSPRMTLCAGLCCYEGRGGLCSIRLSQPLLKLRPRRDLVQTLLHEMIHALLFVTNNNKDHDGHGPEFLKHMHRINNETGAKITVYHSFHDEVDVYRQHWWKCNGPCQKRPPYYGIVRRAMNRAPSARDPWWADHQRTCGGVYTKIKEPDGYGKKKTTKRERNCKGEEHPVVKSSNGNGTLPKFFEVEKKGQSSRSVTDKTDEHAASSETSQQSGGVAGIVPFSGVGHVLGVRQRETSSTRSKLVSSNETLADQGGRTNRKRPENTLSGSKIPSPRKKKRLDTPPGLTIIDAFKRGGQKRETAATGSSTASDIPGSYAKPIEVLEDSPHRGQETVPCKVPCPVCATLVPRAHINQHLDSCLR